MSSSLSPQRRGTARRGYKGMAPFGLDEWVSAQYLEQWINDALSRAEDIGVLGVLTRPEHVKPLNRYGLDRVTLQAQGLKHEEVRAVYRALSVHSDGLFDIVRKIAKQVNLTYLPPNAAIISNPSKGTGANKPSNIPATTDCHSPADLEGKIAVVQGNLWRVYQILVE